VNVPRFKQEKKTCGPTALQMVLAHYNHEVSEREIIKAIGGLKPNGVNTVDLADFAGSRGFDFKCLSYNKKLAGGKADIKVPAKADILKYLEKGVPVILAVNSSVLYGGKTDTPGHFIVLTKYEDGVFSYNDPYDGEEHTIDEEHLIFAWHNNTLNSSAYLLAVWPKNKTVSV